MLDGAIYFELASDDAETRSLGTHISILLDASSLAYSKLNDFTIISTSSKAQLVSDFN